jgi:hypothetical protein
VSAFGDGTSKETFGEVIGWSVRISVLRRRDTKELAPSQPCTKKKPCEDIARI